MNTNELIERITDALAGGRSPERFESFAGELLLACRAALEAPSDQLHALKLENNKLRLQLAERPVTLPKGAVTRENFEAFVKGVELGTAHLCAERDAAVARVKGLEKERDARPWIDGEDIVQGEHEADTGLIGKTLAAFARETARADAAVARLANLEARYARLGFSND